MPHTNPSDEQLRSLLADARTIAVVGASSKPARPSHQIFRRLQLAGYHVVPVTPQETEVLGERAYPTLDAVPEPIDIVDVFRRAEETPAIADSAVAVGARAIWLQSGIWNDETAVRASAGGLVVVMDRCIAVELSRLHVGDRS